LDADHPLSGVLLPRRSTVSEIGDAEKISKSYVSRILRLALLAPDIVDEILSGSTDQALVLERLERPLPASWEEQRAAIDPRLKPETAPCGRPVGCAAPLTEAFSAAAKRS
jgi:hypothetical protein